MIRRFGGGGRQRRAQQAGAARRGQADRVRGLESPADWTAKQRGTHAVTMNLYRNGTPMPASHAGMLRGRT